MRVLNAVAQQTVQDCKGVTLAKKRQVTNGFVTASIVTWYDDTHPPLDIKLFDADNDPVTGNPTQIRKTRDEDNARQEQFAYDPFGLQSRKDVWFTGTISTPCSPSSIRIRSRST